ncbi:MAG: MtnX-like HAD-IB family phosphatase [Rhodanobacteraceae bacterium]
MPSVPTMSVSPATAGTSASEWVILCDFDGTIAIEDVTDALLKRFALPGWERLEQDWCDGRIGSRQCMAGQVALLDAERGELDSLIDKVSIDPDFRAFVEEARRFRMPLCVVSDGLDYAIARILARHGLGQLPIIANRLVANGARRWRLQSPHAVARCRSNSGTCKCSCADRQRRGRHRALLIGDGRSDFCAAESADLVFAKSHLLDHCRVAGIAHRPIENFRDALALLPGLYGTGLLPAAGDPTDPLSLRVRMA